MFIELVQVHFQKEILIYCAFVNETHYFLKYLEKMS